MNSPVSFLTILRQDRLQRSEMFSWNKIINALKRSRGNINPFTTFKPSGWKCYKTIGSYVSCAFIEIWSTWEVWRALKKLELLSAMPRATLTHLSCSPNFPRASYLDERTLTYVNYWALYFSAGRLETVFFFRSFGELERDVTQRNCCINWIYSSSIRPDEGLTLER